MLIRDFTNCPELLGWAGSVFLAQGGDRNQTFLCGFCFLECEELILNGSSHSRRLDKGKGCLLGILPGQLARVLSVTGSGGSGLWF